MTKIPSVEEWKLRVEALHPTSFCNAHDIDEMNWEHDKKGTIEMIEEALTAEREAGREEERANIPVSFLRQWINEDMKQPHQELVTNEDIMRFINIGYGK